MYPGPPRKSDGRVTWRSATAGTLLNAAIFGIFVAVSHPVATGGVIATGFGLYALRRILRRSSVTRRPSFDRTLRLSRREVSLCLQLRIE